MENQPKTAAERALNNRYLLDRLRRQLINRQPGNEVFEQIVANLSPEDLLRHWRNHGSLKTR